MFLAFLFTFYWHAAAEESSPGAGRIPSGVSWVCRGPSQSGRTSGEAVGACSSWDRCWQDLAGTRSSSSQSLPHLQTHPWEELGDQECCHQGRWHRRALPAPLGALVPTWHKAWGSELPRWGSRGTRCTPSASCRLCPAHAPAPSSSSGHCSPGAGNPPLGARAAGGGEEVEECSDCERQTPGITPKSRGMCAMEDSPPWECLRSGWSLWATWPCSWHRKCSVPTQTTLGFCASLSHSPGWRQWQEQWDELKDGAMETGSCPVQPVHPLQNCP